MSITLLLALARAEEGDASGLAVELHEARRASDADRWFALAVESTLRSRTAGDNDALMARLAATVEIAEQGGVEGLEAPLLSLAGEAWARGVSEEALTRVFAPLRGRKSEPASATDPAFVPVAAAHGYGARFVRTAFARLALEDLLVDPTGSLESHFGDALCTLDDAELARQFGDRVAAELRALCDAGTLFSGVGASLGGAVLGAVSDFDCWFADQGPAFDEQVSAAMADCTESVIEGGGNPLTDGSGFVREWETHHPDGSTSTGVETEDGTWSELRVWPNGCASQTVRRPDGSYSQYQRTPSGESSTVRYNPDGTVQSEDESEGYDEDCKKCQEPSPSEPAPLPPLAGEPYTDPDVQWAQPIDTAECHAFYELIHEHLGRELVDPAVAPSRGRVSYPSPDAEPATDAGICLQQVEGVAPAEVAPGCGLKMCPLGSVADDTCECRSVSYDAVLGAMDAGACHTVLLDCDGPPVVTGGICTCPRSEPDVGPPGDDGWSWR